MKAGYFIIGLILIFECSFRLWSGGENAPEYHFYYFNYAETDTVRWYVYNIFQHITIIGLCTILYIENTRYRFLIFLFGMDLVSYLLNYSSIWGVYYGVPIGMDLIKLLTFGGVIAVESLRYHYGLDTALNEHRNFISNAYGKLSAPLWVRSLRRLVSRHNDSGANQKTH